MVPGLSVNSAGDIELARGLRQPGSRFCAAPHPRPHLTGPAVGLAAPDPPSCPRSCGHTGWVTCRVPGRAGTPPLAPTPGSGPSAPDGPATGPRRDRPCLDRALARRNHGRGTSGSRPELLSPLPVSAPRSAGFLQGHCVIPPAPRNVNRTCTTCGHVSRHPGATMPAARVLPISTRADAAAPCTACRLEVGPPLRR